MPDLPTLTPDDLVPAAATALDASYRRLAGPFAPLFPITPVDVGALDACVAGEYTLVPDPDAIPAAVAMLAHRGAVRLVYTLVGRLLESQAVDTAGLPPGAAVFATGTTLDALFGAGCWDGLVGPQPFDGGYLDGPTAERGYDGMSRPVDAAAHPRFQSWLPTGVAVVVLAGHEPPIGRVELTRNANRLDGGPGVHARAFDSGSDVPEQERLRVYFGMNCRIRLDRPDAVRVLRA